VAQHVRQLSRAELARSTSAVAEARQPGRLARCHRPLPSYIGRRSGPLELCTFLDSPPCDTEPLMVTSLTPLRLQVFSDFT